MHLRSDIVEKHPVQSYKQPADFIDLVRTYVDVDTVYYPEVIEIGQPVRLTNMESGEYVLIEAQAAVHVLKNAQQRFADEYLMRIMPEGVIRVRYAGAFYIYCPDNYENWRFMHFQQLGIVFSISDDQVSHTFVPVTPIELALMRTEQIRCIRRTWLRFDEYLEYA